jgi:hypothetical protein
MNRGPAVQVLQPRQAAIHCRLNPQIHGHQPMVGRGLPEVEIRLAIRTGTLRSIGRGNKWSSENRILRVIYRVRPCNIYLITVMDRRR